VLEDKCNSINDCSDGGDELDCGECWQTSDVADCNLNSIHQKMLKTTVKDSHAMMENVSEKSCYAIENLTVAMVKTNTTVKMVSLSIKGF
jgi:ABC-type uncharacterized transport system ATPase subunit